MKSFRRVAFLALALALILSVGVHGQFSDGGKIKYDTAVGVMHGAGILSGYTDGTFRPEGTISREEAAKMVTYAALGESGVMALELVETDFLDVPQERWSSRYVKWCADNGIVGGLGNGAFDPTGKVTGYQLAKMLLCACGYGQNGEYTGLSWEVKSAADGFAKGIFSGIVDADPSRSVTRQEAALYIFNAMTRIEQVRYNKETQLYEPVDNTPIADNTLAAAKYGIVDVNQNSTIHRVIITENYSNGAQGTVINGEVYNYDTPIDLLGHQVSAYTNGTQGIRSRLYYVEDNSSSLVLEQPIAGKDAFIKALGEVKISPRLCVFSDQGVLTGEHLVDGLDLAQYTAPAGTYVFCQGELISYLPIINEYAAIVDSKSQDTVVIGGQSFDAKDVVCQESYAEADVVLARLVAQKRLVITHASAISGLLRSVGENDKGTTTYVVDGYTFLASDIELRGVPIPEAQSLLGEQCRVYLDSNNRAFAVVAE